MARIVSNTTEQDSHLIKSKGGNKIIAISEILKQLDKNKVELVIVHYPIRT